MSGYFFWVPIWTPNCPIATADRHFVFCWLIFLLFAMLFHFPTAFTWKSILLPDVQSSLFISSCFFPFSILFLFLFILFWYCYSCLALASLVCFFAVSLGNIFQYLHVNHEKHVKFVCLVKTSLLRLELGKGRVHIDWVRQ